ncbi:MULTISPECIES: hypothetical protein [unclassified Okeania]|uniref:Uncharacterized protein n=3 Tax=Microcoleaceae TaxID=1892252 RepID=A0A3N6NXZ9_9CYAN|nr:MULTISPECIES: hypothetical protein [unclassified Okeania]NES88310.1 hypothetical protein [Okeania sp. SIO2B9]RQH20511.1 hypothetical protein D5R40_32000 [Okeania hirsuta]NES74439.1 hypothetical protein [Okeania sp. SIO1H4]NET18155.1 hypothetical protein [Okeania sp. SIO1H5]NET77412.1 hypothetical protein [Okeania sp. SIO1F9]
MLPDMISLGDLTQEQIDAGVPPGEITLTFDSGISNGVGADFVDIRSDRSLFHQTCMEFMGHLGTYSGFHLGKPQ